MNNLQRPIEFIQGVGPEAARELSEAGAQLVGDLLRADSRTIHAIVRAHTSIEQAKAWRQMAQFLEIEEMTADHAEVLVWRGVRTLADLANLTPEQVREHFLAGKDAGKVRDLPNQSVTFEIVRSALRLSLTGVIMGTVFEESGKPAPGATVRGGMSAVACDDRGRFRISLLPPNKRLLVVAQHSDLGRAGIVLPVQPTDSPVLSQIKLNAMDGEALIDRSQRRGESLPRLGDYPFVQQEVKLEELMEGELVRYILRYADEKHAKLTTKLLDFKDGHFTVKWVKVPLEALPPHATLRDHFLWRAGKLKPIKMNPAKLRSYKRLQKVRASRLRSKTPANGDELNASFLATMDSLVDGKVFERRA